MTIAGADAVTIATASGETDSPWRTVARSAGARALVLPVSALLGIVNTRLIIDNFGRDVYAQYGLLVTIVSLLPFADLGMSAAILNATAAADEPARDDHLRRVLVTSVRVLLGSAVVLVAVAGAITALGWWPALLGDGLLPGSGPRAAALCLTLMALTLPVAFGQRVLTGLGRNHVTVLVLGLQTPIVLVALVLMLRLDADLDTSQGGYLPVVPYAASMALSLAVTAWAARLVRPTIGRALRAVPRVRREPGAPVFHLAWPMLIQLTVLPLALQTDRLLLSHLAGPGELATYNLASQIYWPVWQVTTAGSIALWPIFARARARNVDASPMPLAAGFAGGAVAVCLVLSVASPWLAKIASDGRIELPVGILVAFSVLMVGHAAKYPLGVWMTDAAGLRFQAYMCLAMLPVNLGISVVLTRRYGAVGPVVGSAVGVLVFHVAANWLYVRRARRSGGSPRWSPST